MNSSTLYPTIRYQGEDVPYREILENGERTTYRSGSPYYPVWEDDPTAFRDHAHRYPDGIAARIMDEAYAANEEFNNVQAVRESAGGPRAYEPTPVRDDLRDNLVGESKDEQQARTIGATDEQLARLRALVSAERENVRMAREIIELRDRLNQYRDEQISSYDERIRPMLEDLAELAERRGFCSEFDLVLDHIGAPSRDELLPENDYLATVVVSFPFTVSIQGRSQDDAWDATTRAVIAEQIASAWGANLDDLPDWDYTIQEVERDE